MILKKREIPLELQLLRSLRPRMQFSEKEESYYQHKEKGFEGELHFDKWAEPLKDIIFLNDLNILYNKTNCQIDSIGISSSTIHIFEIKNFEGDYTIKEGKWYSPKGFVVNNPLIQLEKAETIVNQLVKNFGYSLTVQPHLIFINPDFHLYDAPSNLPIVYPTQLVRVKEKLQRHCTKITRTETQFAEKLYSINMDKSPHANLPEYKYESLRKGIVCPNCRVFYKSMAKCFYCESCEEKESCYEAVLRSVEEFKTLFPDCKVTTTQIQEWCGIVQDKRTIRRVLVENYKGQGLKMGNFYL
ncbi:nuclease-related domain-containing protein [Sutcliffiella deserti]|uniref:nuclease-related domain-containing protein n=1 Tax=Sutcliffiella deserti TaxID=2875501 RepID=UPI001CC08B80|nr:nuclease-related domain-containing protein [Sutcliffiella deserti]